jgi:hypothetical protein
MKPYIFLLIIVFSNNSFGQFKIDTSIRKEYWSKFEKLSLDIKKDEDQFFKSGLAIIVKTKIDTLNKKDILPVDTSIKVIDINLNSGKESPMSISKSDDELVSENNQLWLNCSCKFKRDTLEIKTGISLFSGFVFTTKLLNNKTFAFYSEYARREKIFRTKLVSKKVSEFTIPSTINDIVIDRSPVKGIREVIGKISVTSNGFYSYANAWDFKNEYIYKKIKVDFLFRCVL